MKLQLCVVSFALILAVSATAQDHDIEYQETIRFEVEEDGENSYELNSTVEISHKFLSERSTRERVFTIPETYFAEVDDIWARLDRNSIRQENISFRYPPNEDLFLTDFKLHSISVRRDIEVGQTLTYGYERNYRSIAFLPVLWIPNLDYLKKYEVVVEHPEDVTVTFELFTPYGPLQHTIKKLDNDETALTIENVMQQPDLPYYPFNGIQGAVRIVMRRGDRPVNPGTTREFVSWYLGLFNRDAAVGDSLDGELTQKLKSITDPLEKVQAIHDHVRNGIRYIADEGAINAIVPREPGVVLQRGYGDCKDRAFLVAALAKKHGVDVEMVLVGTSPRPLFEGAAYVSQFNHAIAVVEKEGKPVFFDPTHRYCEFYNLPESDVGARALILDRENPKMMVIPPPNPKNMADITIRASAENPKKGVAEIRLRNDMLWGVARAKDELTAVELENYVSRLLNSRLNKISLEYFEVTSLEDTVVTLTADADISKFLIASTTKQYLPMTPFRTIDPDVVKREKDTLPVVLPERESMSMRIELEAPGYTIGSDDLSIGEGPISFSATSVGAEPGKFSFQYDFSQNVKYFEGERKNDFLEFCKGYLGSKNKMFILKKAE